MDHYVKYLFCGLHVTLYLYFEIFVLCFLMQVQEIHLTTSLDQEGIKKALQRVLERVP